MADQQSDNENNDEARLESRGDEELADAGDPSDDADALAAPSDAELVGSLLGAERWVQFGFIALAFVFFFLVDRTTSAIWGMYAEPNASATTAIAAAVAFGGAFALFRHPTSRQFADEVVTELAQVTWPTREETWTHTIVVIVTSVVAAAYTGLFDAIWSALTDLVYNV